MINKLSNEQYSAEVFLERLESLVKNYLPEDFAPKIAWIIDESLKDQNLCAKFPPHYLIHAIEANCVYHRKHPQDQLNDKKLRKVINHYIGCFDPLAKHFLVENDDGFFPFFINMARQQFYLQATIGRNDIARSTILFGQGNYKHSEILFVQKFGLNYFQWIKLGFCIYAYVTNHNPAYISPQYFLTALPKIVPDEVIAPFFDLLSTTPQAVRETYLQTRKQLGSKIGLYYDTYIQSPFLEKPLLKLKEDLYLVIHKELLARKALEGVFDLFKTEGIFGKEFGKTFESYIEKILLEFIPTQQIFTENNLRKYTNEKVCDFLVNSDDYILLVECKGTEYSAITASVNALQRDNSTRKISRGIIQMISTANQIKNNLFFDLLGDISNKKIIATVITFKHIYFTNLDWYRENVIYPHIDRETLNHIEKLFAFHPQILSVDELEKILVHSSTDGMSIYKIFEEKLSQSIASTGGEWGNYLQPIDVKIPLLEKGYEAFFDKVIKEAT